MKKLMFSLMAISAFTFTSANNNKDVKSETKTEVKKETVEAKTEAKDNLGDYYCAATVGGYSYAITVHLSFFQDIFVNGEDRCRSQLLAQIQQHQLSLENDVKY